MPKPISKHIQEALNAFWLYLPATITVCLIYYVLMGVDLAVDTLMIVGESYKQMGLLLLVIFIWSWIVWFSSRLVSLVPLNKLTTNNIFVSQLPRFFAINCYVAIQCAILSLSRVWNMSGWVIVVFIALHVAFYILVTYAHKQVQLMGGKLKSPAWWVAQIIGWCYILALLALSICNYKKPNPAEHSYTLPFVAALLYLLQVSSNLIYIKRRDLLDKKVAPNRFTSFLNYLSATRATKFHERLLLKLNIASEEANNEAVFYLLFHIVCVLALVFFSLNISFITISSAIGPLTFTVLALSMIIVLFNLIAAFSRRVGFNLNLLLFAFILIMGGLTPKHDVRTISQSPNSHKCISTETFVNCWLENPVRKKSIADSDSSNPYIAYIILNDGGGARAATWSTWVMSKLDDTTNGKFSEHLFAMAGASGGSVGNTAFYGLLKSKNDSKGKLVPHAYSFFRNDFLTYTLGRFFGTDFISYLIPFNVVEDRAAALENTFEFEKNDPRIAHFFASAADTAFDYEGKLPALFINVTDVKYGITSIVSNVLLKDKSHINLLDSLHIKSQQTLRVSTCAILSARFPYISPAGRLNERYYVDGGYFDNSGAGTITSFMEEVYKVLPQEYKEKIEFRVIELHNGKPYNEENYKMHPLTNDLLAPVITLIGVQNASTETANRHLFNYMSSKNSKIQRFSLNLYSYTTKEGYPMSWINSNYQLDRIKTRVDSLAGYDASFQKIIEHLNR